MLSAVDSGCRLADHLLDLRGKIRLSGGLIDTLQVRLDWERCTLAWVLLDGVERLRADAVLLCGLALRLITLQWNERRAQIVLGADAALVLVGLSVSFGLLEGLNQTAMAPIWLIGFVAHICEAILWRIFLPSGILWTLLDYPRQTRAILTGLLFEM